MFKNSLIIFLLCACTLFAADNTFDGAVDNTYGNAGNWSLGNIPTGGDSAIIPAEFNVTLDSDQSALTPDSLAINGTLTMAATASAVLNVTGQITGTGTLLCGTSAVPLPAARSAYIDLSGTGGTISHSTLDVQLYCLQPSRLHTTLAAAFTVGQTEVTVADDVSDWWDDRPTGFDLQIRIDQAKGGVNGSTLYTVTGISADGKTITIAYNDAKASGDTVVLITRNVRIVQTNVGVVTTNLVAACKSGSVFGAEIRTGSTRFGFSLVSGITTSGSISGCSRGWDNSSGTNTGTISGCDYGWYISTGVNTGTISGCTSGWNRSSGVNTGTISGCTSGWFISSGINAGTISGNTNGLNRSYVTGYGGTITGNTSDNTSYDRLPPLQSSMLYDDGGVAGAFRGYSQGGLVTSQAGANGFTVTYLHTKDPTSNICLRQTQTQIPPGTTLSVSGIIKVAGDHTGYIPRIEIVDIGDDPIVGGSALATANLPVYDGTNTAYQNVACSYTNTTAYVKDVYIRVSSSTLSEDIEESFRYLESGGSGGWGTTGGGFDRKTSRF